MNLSNESEAGNSLAATRQLLLEKAETLTKQRKDNNAIFLELSKENQAAPAPLPADELVDFIRKVAASREPMGKTRIKCDDVNQSTRGGDKGSAAPARDVNQSTRVLEKRELRESQEKKVARAREKKADTLENRALELAIALAEEEKGARNNTADEWRLPFDLARRLRTIANDRPERFSHAVAAFASALNLDFEEMWMGFLDSWDKVIYPEGADVFTVAAERSESSPWKVRKNRGDCYGAVASLAYHLSTLTKEQHFCLPRQRIGKWLNRSAMMVSRIVNLLVLDKVIEEVDGTYSYQKKQAKIYRFVGITEEPS